MKPALMNLNLGVSTLSLLALSASPDMAQPVTPKSKPNIVYILTDDLGYGDVGGFYPGNKIKTPQLDQFTASGMTFTEAHASSAVCTPSRYSILTGRYNWRSTLKQGVLGGFSKPLIEDGRMTVASLLSDHGYQTACIGKWHLGLGWSLKPDATPANVDMGEDESSTKPQNRNAGAGIDFAQPIAHGPTTVGFDYFFGISASLDMPPYTYIENDHVTDLPTIARGTVAGADGKPMRIGPQAPGFKAEDVLPNFTRHAIDYVDQHAGTAHAGNPFFLYWALPTPHTPIAPSAAWQGKSGLSFYADYVMETDDSIGQFLAALDRDGLTTNTLVIIASDNGCSPAAGIAYLLAHGHDPSAGRRGYKADIYDGGHRIPMIVRWPDQGAPGDGKYQFRLPGRFHGHLRGPAQREIARQCRRG